ncbi:MAG: two-component system sensor histidine kinase CreC [Desulfuromonadales bacterium GWD2_61_12]|nr:MAG: two-component system sensor histidine kinase CreC [Desulfuromonadales bacterium GWD2_61_12]
MSLGARIFLCYLVIFSACFYYPIQWMIGNLEARYRESVEEIMVDQAHILAGQVAGEMAAGRFDPQTLRAAFLRARQQPLAATIYDLRKTTVDSHFYLTDAAGRIIADSREPTELGADYAAWNDVHLTLRGAYGTRTTRRDPLDPTTSSLYVAAPVVVAGQIVGCLTLIKPTASINVFLAQARPRVLQAGALALAAAMGLSLLFSIWLTRPIKRLIHYAEGIGAGRRPAFPELGRSEIAELGQALHQMQVALEGKQYVEEYVQNLTHEIKSPLSAIRGAAELIDEAMPPERRERFLENIRTEAARIGRIVDTMLELAALENRRLQPEMQPLDLHALLANVIESKQPLLQQKHLDLQLRAPERLTIPGNGFLLHQALANLLQNAIDFSPPGGRIDLAAEITDGKLVVTVADAGAGIPDYARERIFDKFYSLQRPDSGRKSTGLGLNLVREVVTAHNGSVRLGNRAGGGAEAIVVLPLATG